MNTVQIPVGGKGLLSLLGRKSIRIKGNQYLPSRSKAEQKQKGGMWAPFFGYLDKLPIITGKQLSDKSWNAMDLSSPKGKKETDKIIASFRLMIWHRFNQAETIRKNGFGIYCAKRDGILFIAKIAANEEEMAEMFRNGGRGKGRIKQTLSIRTKVAK